jgi:hypothetical protein
VKYEKMPNAAAATTTTTTTPKVKATAFMRL